MTGIDSPPLSVVPDDDGPDDGSAGGPQERFRELFAEHFRDLLGYALRRVVAPEDAADVVAETMLVAWRRLDEVPADGTARLWLYGVARRVLANYRRGEVRRGRLGERLRLQLATAAPDLADSVASGTVLGQALARLSSDDRELLQLTVWEGLAPQEVAAVLGVAPGTVRARLHRARKRLRAELGDAFDAAGHVRDNQHPQPVQEEDR